MEVLTDPTISNPLQINGNTKLLGVIGNPISHTMSPLIHNTFSQMLGLNYAYVPFGVEQTQLPQAIYGCRALGVEGINITVPYKSAVIPYLDHIDQYAKLCDSVNTIRINDGKLYGYSTDGYGFLKALGDFPLKDASVTILGAGGAAKAVCHALLSAGISTLTIVNRTRETATKLAQSLSIYPAHIKVSDTVTDCQLLINATSVGMQQDDSPFSDFHTINDSCLVYDLIYNPRQTEFLGKAQERGLQTINGFGMLIHQGAEAYRIFTGIEPDQQLTNYVQNRFSPNKNIVLAGFMGTGKSTIGEILKKTLGTTLIDIDQQIVMAEGMSIDEIFQKKGQVYFRQLEHKIIKQASKKHGIVIALGGGSLIDPNNVECLKKTGKLICLTAPIQTIYDRISCDKNRPLANGKTMEQLSDMLKQRQQYYDKCDVKINSDTNALVNILDFMQHKR